MSPEATKIYEQYLALPERERENLIALILEGSDEPTVHPLASEWDAEIHSRIEEIDSGKVELASREIPANLERRAVSRLRSFVRLRCAVA